MHKRSTTVLVVVAVALFVFILLFERDGRDANTVGGSGPGLFSQLDVSKVTALTITWSNRPPIRLQHVRGQWQLADPVYPAQALLVENWLKSLVDLKRHSHLAPDEVARQPGGLAALGLQPARAKVVVEQGPVALELRLGDRTPFKETMWLQRAGEQGVEVTGVEPWERLPGSAAAWRDPRFLHLSGVRFDGIRMEAAAREYRLQRDPVSRHWRLAEPRPARADHGRVEQLLQQLQELTVLAFADEVTEADLEPLGLEPAVATLRLLHGTNDVARVDFGQSPTNAPEQVFARRSHLPGVVLVPRETMDLVAVPYTDLLDYQLVSRSLDALQRVEIRADERFTLERQTNGVWRIESEPVLPADPGLIASFLELLRRLRVAEVAKEVVTEMDLASYGLAAPARQFALHWTNGVSQAPTILQLDFGGSHEGKVYVRRSDETPVYAVGLEDALALPRAAFELRDRRLWQFETNEVTSVSIMKGGSTNRLLRSAGGKWAFAPGSQGIVNTFALEEAVHRLGDLRARYWIDRGTNVLANFGIPQTDHRLAIEVKQQGQIYLFNLAFGASSPSGGPFTAIELESGPTVFECPLDVFYPYDEVVRSMVSSQPSQP